MCSLAVAITEFGSDCNLNTASNCTDASYLSTISTYMTNTGDATAYPHQPVRVWFWWCWNANSGDTGGIVTGDKTKGVTAWYTIKWYKVDWLGGLGLCPWYKTCA
jgi:hypothetical protein